ncbi:MAG: hypothetical protein IJT77_00210 [Clostridia bacterium]|nr:hypothetical protein [Clostridia bacterium]
MIKPGDRFGKLTVLSIQEKTVLCQCDCGNEKRVNKYNLLKGSTRSCGCLRLTAPVKIGDVFGMLTVLEDLGNRKMLCRCQCGNEKIICKDSLTSGGTHSCGCIPRGKKPIIISPGTRFGLLTVLSMDGQYVLCRCDCGNEKRIGKSNLLHGITRSCGCLKKQRRNDSSK